jgi:hypothetical protein
MRQSRLDFLPVKKEHVLYNIFDRKQGKVTYHGRLSRQAANLNKPWSVEILGLTSSGRALRSMAPATNGFPQVLLHGMDVLRLP